MEFACHGGVGKSESDCPYILQFLTSVRKRDYGFRDGNEEVESSKRQRRGRVGRAEK